jgi:hypothetical protein
MPREMQIPPGSASPSRRAAIFTPSPKKISVLQHDVADINPDAKLHSTFFFEVVIRVSKLLLDIDRALDSRQRAAERGENAVAEK